LQTSGFWAGAYLVVMLYMVVRTTWARDEDAGRRILWRVRVAAGIVWALLHAWALWELVTGLRGVSRLLGARLTPGDQAKVIYDVLRISEASWALLAGTVAACALATRSPRRDGRAKIAGLLVAGSLVAAAILIPLEGFYTPRAMPLMGTRPPEPGWIDRACLLGGLTALIALLVVVAAMLSVLFGKGPIRSERKQALGRDLALWGFLLLAGSVLLLEQSAIQCVTNAAVLGPMFTGWPGHIRAFLQGTPFLLFAMFLGLVALSFGTLHLRRQGLESPAGGA
jgi:hypothetical protein